MATSTRPPATAWTASPKAQEPVAEAFSTWVTGIPVNPNCLAMWTPAVISPPRYPLYSAPTSEKFRPASSSAAIPATSAIDDDESPSLLKRCMPTPRTKTFCAIRVGLTWRPRSGR